MKTTHGLAVAVSVAAVMFVALPATPRAQAGAAATPLSADRIQAIDAYVRDQLRERRIPGAAIAVLEGGRVAYEQAYGVANLESGAPVTDSSRFHLASLTKPFTAAAIMLLAKDGRLRLDEPIGTYIDQAPPAWREITVRHLLTHTSGISPGAIVRVDSAGSLTTRQGIPLHDIPAALALRVIAQTPVLFPAGERIMYCDAGYFLLGLVIEKTSGRSYARFLEERIFQPLQMSRAGLMDRWRIVPGSVPVYTLRGGQHAPWRRDWQYELDSFAGMTSTLRDLERWDAALRSGTLLDRATLDSMWTPVKLRDGRTAVLFGDCQGLGWALGEVRGHRTAEHAGASGTHLLRFLDDALTVIVLTNLEGPSGSRPAAIARGIAGLVDPALEPPQSASPRPDPAPATSRALREMLAEMSAGRASAAMTPEYRAAWERDAGPGRREDARLLGLLGPLTFLARDDARAAWPRSGRPVAAVAHYRGQIEGRPYTFSFWLTADGKVAHLRFQPD